jgi:hypothetical protein
MNVELIKSLPVFPIRYLLSDDPDRLEVYLKDFVNNYFDDAKEHPYIIDSIVQQLVHYMTSDVLAEKVWKNKTLGICYYETPFTVEYTIRRLVSAQSLRIQDFMKCEFILQVLFSLEEHWIQSEINPNMFDLEEEKEE